MKNLDVTFNEVLAYFSTEGSSLQGEMDGIFEENSYDDIPIVATSLLNDQRHDNLDITNSLEEGNSLTTRPHTADNTIDSSSLSPKHVQSTHVASKEVLFEPDETMNETNDVLNTTSKLDLQPKSEPPSYQLPASINRGKPKTQYDADLNSEGKYSISNYVSTH